MGAPAHFLRDERQHSWTSRSLKAAGLGKLLAERDFDTIMTTMTRALNVQAFGTRAPTLARAVAPRHFSGGAHAAAARPAHKLPLCQAAPEDSQPASASSVIDETVFYEGNGSDAELALSLALGITLIYLVRVDSRGRAPEALGHACTGGQPVPLLGAHGPHPPTHCPPPSRPPAPAHCPP